MVLRTKGVNCASFQLKTFNAVAVIQLFRTFAYIIRYDR